MLIQIGDSTKTVQQNANKKRKIERNINIIPISSVSLPKKVTPKCIDPFLAFATKVRQQLL
jgi:hypothetical protein